MTSPVVAQCLVIGDRKPFIAALITLDLDDANAWLTSQGAATADSLEELSKNPIVHRQQGERRRLARGVDPQVRDPARRIHAGERHAHSEPQVAPCADRGPLPQAHRHRDLRAAQEVMRV